jgi:pheromone shutdown-related protein TraB
LIDEARDITRVDVDGREIILIGTAHISQQSVDTVLEVLATESPDTVCVELDEQRFKALREQTNWEEVDLVEIIRTKQTTFLAARLALMAFQKRMSNYTGVKPGSEMLAALDKAEEIGAEVVLADRDIRQTLLRAWRTTPFLKKGSLLVMLLAGLFEQTEVDEEDLEDLREAANLTEVMEELGDAMPEVKTALVDERDAYMAERILSAPGDKIAVVIGAAHKAGILKRLEARTRASLDELSELPERSAVSRFLPWILPAIVIGLFVGGFFFGDTEKLQDAAIAWFVVNGLGAGIMTALAAGHPLTVLAGMLAAPFTSLNPAVGAGMATGLVQTWVASPKVRDFESIGDDISEWTGWWKNRLARVLLVFIFANLGSTIGTFVALRWFADVFN